jgi:eukaryotic-like serine/threonine-protein kinase
MNPNRWQEIKRVFEAALDLAPSQRLGYLVDACKGDDQLRYEVESLLTSFDESRSFMEQPGIGEVADMIVETRPQLCAGDHVGHYRIIEPIGAGGMGEVYLAHDLELERDVAVKILAADVAADQQRMQRFIREAKSASTLNHPNIITIYEVGLAEGLRFIATEFIKGETLRQRLRRERLSLRECFEVAVQLARALSAAHEARVVHRDIKPENIMLRPDGLVKVLDFGLAKLTEKTSNLRALDSNAATRFEIKTVPGMVMGTANYMSPEQARGKEVDLRTDIWSFGVVLYEMLTDRLPFTGETPTDVMAALLKDEPPPLATLAPDAPAELQRITRKALRKEPDERYQSAKDLLLDLKTLQRELDLAAELERSMPSQLRDVTAAEQSSPPAKVIDTARTASSAEYFVSQIRRHRRSVLLALAALAVTVAIFSYFFLLKRKTAALTEQDTILLADFDNKTGDAVFDDALKQGLAAQLQQSPFLNLLPDSKARQTLRLMNHPPNERMTRDVAREVCQRQELKALVAGTIAKFDRNYSLALEVVNCQTGDTIALTQAQADGKDQVLSALSHAASDLREKLGESLTSIKKFDVPIDQLTTGSLDALKAYSLAFDRSNKGKYFESVPLFRHATELDPNFAYAYALLAGNYIILNQPRHAADNAARAFALKDRLSEREKLYVTNYYDVAVTGELDKSVEDLEVYKRTYPEDFRPPGNLSLTYSLLGQFEKSEGEARESVRLNPNISAWNVTLGTALIRLDRFGEAKKTFEGALQLNLDDARIHSGLYQIAFIDHDATAMQEQLDWARGLPEEYFAADLQTSTAAYLGQWRQAQDSGRRAIELAGRVDVKEVAGRYAAEQSLRAAVLGRCEQTRNYNTQSLALERNQVTLSRVALSQALCGDGQAQTLIDELNKQRPGDTIVNGLWLPVIHAAIELTHGNAAQAVESLEPARAYEPAAEFWPQYIRGLAYLKMNKGTEAAAEFQRILDHRGGAPLSILYPLANRGLADAAFLSGDQAVARRTYEDFLAQWKDADDDLPVLIAAKTRLANLKGG